MRSIILVKNDKPLELNPGPAPMLQWVRIENLVVDDSYQRDLKRNNWDAIRRIAGDFRWSRFSPVFCAPITGGKYAIIDGQHRTHAAAMCGFEEVPCQIVQMTHSEQAESFAAVNGAVTKVTGWDLYKAGLSAGEPWAVEVKQCAENAGCRIMLSNGKTSGKKPGQIFSPMGFRKLIDQRSAEGVSSALSLLMNAEGYNDNYNLWDAAILFPIVSSLAGDAEFLARGDAVQVLEGFDIWAAIDAIDEERKRRTRLGLPLTSRKDMLANAVTKAISEAD